MLTARELFLLVERGALWQVADGVKVAVRIVDAKTSYGVSRVLVVPLQGIGSKWVDLCSVDVDQVGR